MGGSSKGPRTPKPSKAENALRREQVRVLKQQQRIIQEQQQVAREALKFQRQQAKVGDLLQPILFEEAGLQPKFNRQGNIVGFDRIESPADDLRQEVETGLLERTLAGLKGELPVSPALVRSLDEQEAKLNEELVRDFGSLAAARLSSAGGERLSRFGELREGTLEAARRGDISQATQLALGAQRGNILGNQQTLGNLQVAGGDMFGDLQRFTTLSNLFAGTSAGFASNAAGFSAPLGVLENQKTLQLKAAIARAQENVSGREFAGQLFGTALGAAAGTYGGRVGTALPLPGG